MTEVLMQRLQILIVMVLLLSFSTGGFARIETLSLDDLVIQSDVIAIATLKNAEKMPKDEKDGFTRIKNTVSLSLILKGEAKTVEDIVIETIDGIEDEPVFEPRVRFILFLQKNPTSGIWHTTNLIQGFWILDKDENPLGMGLGTSKAQLEQVILKTRGQKPKPVAAPTPAY
jgi:hypothetical protein